MYQPSHFKILLHLQHGDSDRLSLHQLMYEDKTLTHSIVEDSAVDLVKSYEFDNCCIVQDVADGLVQSAPLITAALEGYNSVMLFMNTKNSTATSLIQRHIHLLYDQIKKKNTKLDLEERTLLQVKYCYMNLGDIESSNLLKQEKIPVEHIIANGLERYMTDWTTVDELNQVISSNSTNMAPKLLALNITDGILVNGYLYLIDLQQPFAANGSFYPLSSSFKSLVTLSGKLNSSKDELKIDVNSCILVYLLVESLVGRHYAILYLDTESSPQNDCMTMVEQSISFAQTLSYLHGFAAQNSVAERIPRSLITCQYINHEASVLEQQIPILELEKASLCQLLYTSKLQILEQEQQIPVLELEKSSLCQLLYTSKLQSLEQEQQIADIKQHMSRNEKNAQDVIEPVDSHHGQQSVLSVNHKLKEALQDISALETKLDKACSDNIEYQVELQCLHKVIKGKNDIIVAMKNSYTAPIHSACPSKFVTSNEDMDVLELQKKEKKHMLKEEKTTITRLNRKVDILQQDNQNLVATCDAYKADKENWETHLARQLYKQQLATQTQITDLQTEIDHLYTTLQQKQQDETRLELEVRQLESDIWELSQKNLDNRSQQLHQIQDEGQQSGQILVNQGTAIYQERISVLTKDLEKEQALNGRLKEKIKSQTNKERFYQADLEQTKISLRHEEQWSAELSLNAQKERAILLQWVALVKKAAGEQVPDPSNHTMNNNTIDLSHIFDPIPADSLRKHIPVYTFTSTLK